MKRRQFTSCNMYTKFHEDISNSFGVLETKHDGRTDPVCISPANFVGAGDNNTQTVYEK